MCKFLSSYCEFHPLLKTNYIVCYLRDVDGSFIRVPGSKCQPDTVWVLGFHHSEWKKISCFLLPVSFSIDATIDTTTMDFFVLLCTRTCVCVSVKGLTAAHRALSATAHALNVSRNAVVTVTRVHVISWGFVSVSSRNPRQSATIQLGEQSSVIRVSEQDKRLWRRHCTCTVTSN